MDEGVRKTLKKVAQFYDERKAGHMGPLGFRRSSDLTKLFSCMEPLLAAKIIAPHESMFMDLGCADGRVNIFLSYIVKISIGVELYGEILQEYGLRKDALEAFLKKERLLLPPGNVHVFQGDSTDEDLLSVVEAKTGARIEDFDLFYTYLMMHEEFAELIAEKGKHGAIFMVYGLHKILPAYRGFRHLDEISPVEGILALYRKE